MQSILMLKKFQRSKLYSTEIKVRIFLQKSSHKKIYLIYIRKEHNLSSFGTVAYNSKQILY